MSTYTLPAGVAPITSTTTLDTALHISRYFNIDDLTKGTAPFRIGVTTMSPLISPLSAKAVALAQVMEIMTEPWKIAQNLQALAIQVLDPLVTRFGTDLVVYACYINPTLVNALEDIGNKHFTGEAVDIYLRSSASNMYPHVNEIKDLLGDCVVEMGLMFGGVSWLHIGIDGPNRLATETPGLPEWSHDLATGDMAAGMFPMRGFTSNGNKGLKNHLTDGMGIISFLGGTTGDGVSGAGSY